MTNGAYGHPDFDHNICLRLWKESFPHCGVEFPPRAKVLEIGCAEDDWMTPMLVQRPDLNIVGIDWRGGERPGVVIKGDILTTKFAVNTFDCAVGISSVEHIGLGHYDKDPIDVDGDVHCMERVRNWLKPGGWVYADVPFNETGYRVLNTECRLYDEAAIRSRLIVSGMTMTRLIQHIPPDPTAMQYAIVVAVKDA